MTCKVSGVDSVQLSEVGLGKRVIESKWSSWPFGNRGQGTNGTVRRLQCYPPGFVSMPPVDEQRHRRRGKALDITSAWQHPAESNRRREQHMSHEARPQQSNEPGRVPGGSECFEIEEAWGPGGKP